MVVVIDMSAIVRPRDFMGKPINSQKTYRFVSQEVLAKAEKAIVIKKKISRT